MLRFILLVVLYVMATWFSEAFVRGPSQVTLFWPAAGIAFAAVLRYGWRWAAFIPPAVILGHVLFVPVPDGFLFYSAASNTVGALVAYLVFNWRPTTPRLTVGGGFLMLRAAVAMVAASALVGCYGLVRSGMAPADNYWPSVLNWAFGDLLGIVCVAPTMLLLTAPASTSPDLPQDSDYSSSQEKLAWIILLLGSYTFVFLGGERGGVYALGMVALPLALLLWSALRFQPVWSVFGTGLAVLFLTSVTGLGLGGFKPPEQVMDSVLLLAFMGLFATIPLVLMASLHEQRMATRKVLRRATTDAATNLPNRAAFEEAVQEALQSGSARALAYLDLDHFTLVNDTASHAAGDALIHGIGSLLKARLREGDQLFRIGGDEFALLLSGAPETMQLRLEHLQRAVENYRVGWQDQVLNITVSIGLVVFEPGQFEFARLLSLADAACFTAKELGGNRVYTASQEPGEMFERTRAMHWAVRIREAIDRNLFELDCQRIVPLTGTADDGEHIELLLRMRDPESGERLAPGHFIPAAERFQLGVALDRHVVNLALDWLEARPESALRVRSCAINLTAASLVDEGFRAFLFQRVRKSRLPPTKWCFEVTETSAVRDLSRAQELITQMRSLGCQFALDDFGTGFCSFNYLRSLDVDYFKIDGSFVRDIEHNPLSIAVVRSITDIAHVLDKQTVAEHTESEADFATLRALGVDYAQGYGIHKPEPIEQFFQSLPASVRNIA